jgi:O-antigen ligase
MTSSEKSVRNLITFGVPFTSIFLLMNVVTDPVNATKLLILGGVAFGLLAVFLKENFQSNIKNFRWFIFSILLFNISALSALLQSESPLIQNLYGTYGRNTGFIAYLSMTFVALGALQLRSSTSFKNVVYGLFFAGFMNVIYCGWVLLFGDFFSWSNPYGNILGLFGNPNFVGAFLGMFVSALLAYASTPKLNWKYRVFAFIIGLLAMYEILRSKAVQGIMVSVSGAVIVGFFLVRHKFQSRITELMYLFFASVLGVLSILGTLQKGPLSFVYKRSVSLRGTYWESAINMGMERPFSGIGMDSYGDWYRRARPPVALVDTPGVNTTTNAAHNVFLDFFAYGGWPLFISYILVTLFGVLAIVRVLKRNRVYDGTFASLVVIWVCYQIQSIVSINQIGLAIWGWLLTGVLVAYDFSTQQVALDEPQHKVSKKVMRRPASHRVISSNLVAGLGVLVGLIIVSPPLNADMKWRKALDSQNGTILLEALKPSYMNPQNTQRYSQAIQIFANSNLMSEAREIALQALEFNSDSFENWRNFYFLSNTSEEEKIRALENMRRLDPLNPDLIAR